MINQQSLAEMEKCSPSSSLNVNIFAKVHHLGLGVLGEMLLF